MKHIEISKKEIIRWTAITAMLKISWFVFFIVFRNPEWPQHEVIKGIALASGDYEQYYAPLEKFMSGEGYQSACRMPGLLPVYVPVRLLLSAEYAQVTMSVIQVLFDILATMLLAIVAARIFETKRAFIWTCIIYGISTFVSIRSNYLLSDSLSVSMMIIAIYYLSNGLIKDSKKYFWFAGIFIIWSVFLRPAGLILYGCAGLVILYHNRGNILKTTVQFLPVIIPGILLISIWTIRNQQVYGKTIYLQAPMEECYSLYTYEQQSIVAFLLTIGEDFQKWSPGSGSEWFFVSDEYDKHPFSESDFCAAYTIDSLRTLKAEYNQFLKTDNDSLKSALSSAIFEKTERYKNSYKAEKPLRYYIVNRLNYIKMFMFPNRLDDLPLPASAKMNIMQKAAKAGSYLLLLAISALSVISVLYHLIKRNFSVIMWASFGLAFPILLGFIGFIEQRYLTPGYPVMCVLAVGLIVNLMPKKKLV